jgi:hypothetical protein
MLQDGVEHATLPCTTQTGFPSTTQIIVVAGSKPDARASDEQVGVFLSIKHCQEISFRVTD